MPSLENPRMGITSFAVLLGYYYSCAYMCNPNRTLSWRVCPQLWGLPLLARELGKVRVVLSDPGNERFMHQNISKSVRALVQYSPSKQPTQGASYMAANIAYEKEQCAFYQGR